MCSSGSRRSSRASPARSLLLREIPRVDEDQLRGIDVLAEGRVHLLDRGRLDLAVDLLGEGHGAADLDLGGEPGGEAPVLRAIQAPALQQAVLRILQLVGGETVARGAPDLLAHRLLEA